MEVLRMEGKTFFINRIDSTWQLDQRIPSTDQQGEPNPAGASHHHMGSMVHNPVTQSLHRGKMDIKKDGMGNQNKADAYRDDISSHWHRLH